MKKLFFLSLLLLVGCADKKPINIGTAGTTGALYPLGASMAKMYNEKLKNYKVSSSATNGGFENLYLLQKDELDFSFGVASIVSNAYHGVNNFKDKPIKKLRAVAALYENPNQIIVKKNIKNIRDLSSKTISVGSPGSTADSEARVHLHLAGVKIDSVKFQYISPSSATELFNNNKLDALWIMAGVPASSVTELLLTSDVKLLDLDEDFLELLKENYAWYSNYKINKKNYDNLKSDINTSSIKMILYTRDDLDEETVYKFTKTFWENLDTLKSNNKCLKDVQLQNAVLDLGDVPIHPGAIKYYKEMSVIK